MRERTRIGDYLRWLEAHRGMRFDDYRALWQWSVTDLPGFWSSVWDYFDVGERPRGEVLEGTTMPDVTWFPGARLNYAEYLLRRVPDDRPVVVARSQTRGPVEWTGAELRDAVARCRAGLVRLGVSSGDRVAAYLPNIPETVVLLLASASLGATFSSCAPEFGVRSVVDRWQQIEPRVLVAVDGYRYGDKEISRLGEIAEIRAALPGLEAVVGIGYLGGEQADVGSWSDLSWAELLADDAEPAFEPVPFSHPLYILYSSGTTGLPKPIVHGHGGILLEHLKALALHFDMGREDRFFWFTSTGWMMWNFLVSAPAVGAAIVLYDGDPGWPDLTTLWRLADETAMTFFGTSAPFLMACRKAGLRPNHLADLHRLRGMGSTGSPLPPQGFEWVYENVGSDLLLQSFSGGTDLCTGFVGGSPLLPVYAGELSCPLLGAAVAAYDPRGRSVTGTLGELVLEQPMPSMPVGFWGDDG
ncbi:MAG TPA: acetoacetate--CoA ligase, partial [Actinopolymorphaceae bacterium]